MNEATQKIRFGPGFFWLLIPVTWLLFTVGLQDERGGMALPPLWWLFALIGTFINIFRWHRLTRWGKVGLVLLGFVLVPLSVFMMPMFTWF